MSGNLAQSQPWVNPAVVPGMTLNRWGLHLQRSNTWWPFAKSWFEYLQRTQHVLQQGRFVGVLLHATGGPAAASFFLPFRRVRQWPWENAWLLGGLFSWILAPAIAASSSGQVILPTFSMSSCRRP